MDAETRHELKQNELAETLTRLRDLNDPRVRYALYGVAAVILVGVAIYAWVANHRQMVAQKWDELAKITRTLAQEPNASGATAELKALIAENVDPTLTAFARIQYAGVRVQQAFTDAAQRPAGFEDAVKELQPVTADKSLAPMVRAPALFALASAYESLRRPAEAKPLYTQLTTQSEFDGLPQKALAAKRLESFDLAEQTVKFEPGAAPNATPAPAAAPPAVLNAPPGVNITPAPADQVPEGAKTAADAALPPPAPTPTPAPQTP